MNGLLKADEVAIIDWAKKHPEIAKLYLYGSRARGDHHAASDIDLAIEIIVQPGDSDSWTTWIGWHSNYKNAPDLLLSAEVDLQWYEKGANLHTVAPGVEKDGVLLFERRT